MSEVHSDTASEPSIAEVDIGEKRQKADIIDEIDASSHVTEKQEEEDSEGEDMRF